MIDTHFAELEAIAREGATVIVKIDGARSRHDPNIYTLMINGGGLGKEDYFRKDGKEVDKLIKEAISFYNSNRQNKK